MQPLYRLTVYAPYSVDSTETTVLSPIGGAPHSDPFVVTSLQGVSGAKPYLDLPRGKQDSLDPVTKQLTTGRLTLRLLDSRVTAGGSNAVRWVTAFFGDTAGKQRILRCKMKLEESLDGTVGSLTTIFTGRVYGITLESAQWVTLEVRSIRDELKQRRLFTSAPDASVTYASLPSALPPGGVQDWGQFPAVLGLLGATSILTTYTGPKGGTVSYGRVTVDVSEQLLRRIITKQIIGLARIGTAEGDAAVASARVTLTRLDTLASGTFKVSAAAEGSDHKPSVDYSAVALSSPLGGHGYLNSILLESLDPSETGYMAFPPNGTSVRFSVSVQQPASGQAPVLINTQHPVQIWKDILDGKFSPPNSDGSLRPLCAYDSTSFANLIADLSIPAMQFYIDQAAPNAIDWIEKYLLQPRNLAYRFDTTGKLIPLDMRRTKDTATGVPTLTDSDLITDQKPAWSITRDDAVTGVEFTYYVDNQLTIEQLTNTGDYFPDISPIKLDSTDTMVFLAADLTTLTDVGEKIIQIDSQGDRVYGPALNGNGTGNVDIDPDTKQPTALSTALQIEAMLRDYMATFASGSAKVSLRCRRTTTPASLYPGMRALVQVSKLPDTLTNQRGGTRLMLCVSRTEDGPGINLDFVDEGSNVVAAVPTISSAAVPVDDPQAIDVQVALNAASDPVHLWYARTDAGTAAAPAASSPLWVFGGMRTTSGLIRLRPMMKGTRIFLRAQSRSTGATPKLPSDWAFIGGVANTSFVDIGAITAPSAVTVPGGGISGNRATISWTNGDANKLVDVYLTTGGVPGTWTDAMRLITLPAGSTTTPVGGLTPSTGYAVGVRHRDAAGGVSSMATQTFSTTATPTTNNLTPGAPSVGGGTDTNGGIPDPVPLLNVPRSGPPVGVGVVLNLFHPDPGAQLRVEHAPDNGSGAPNTGSITTAGDNIVSTQKTFFHRQPLDGATHWYRTRTVGYGDNPSNPSDWVSAKAVVQPSIGPTQSVAYPLNAQGRYRCKLHYSATLTVSPSTTTAIPFDTEDFDVGNLHDNVTNPSHITVPTGYGGMPWALSTIVNFANGSDTTQRLVSIYKNGSLLVDGVRVAAVNGNSTVVALSWVDVPNDGDFYEVKVWHNAAGNVLVSGPNTFFTAFPVW